MNVSRSTSCVLCLRFSRVLLHHLGRGLVHLDRFEREPPRRVAVHGDHGTTLPVLPFPFRFSLGLGQRPEERRVRRGQVGDRPYRPLQVETLEPVLLGVFHRVHRHVRETPRAVKRDRLLPVGAFDDEPVAPVAGPAAHRVVLVRPRVVRQEYQLIRHARRAVRRGLVELRHRGVEVRIRSALDTHQVPPARVHVLGAHDVKLGILSILLGGETLPLRLDRLHLLLRPQLLVADAPVVILQLGILSSLAARARDPERGHVRAHHRGSG